MWSYLIILLLDAYVNQLRVTFRCLACLQRSGRWRGWLYTYASCLLHQVLGRQTTQSAYMLSALWATGSLHVHSDFCLICCFDVCIKIISSQGIYVLWEHWRPCKRNIWGGGGRVCWMAFTPPNPCRKKKMFFFGYAFYFSRLHIKGNLLFLKSFSSQICT